MALLEGLSQHIKGLNPPLEKEVERGQERILAVSQPTCLPNAATGGTPRTSRGMDQLSLAPGPKPQASKRVLFFKVVF